MKQETEYQPSTFKAIFRRIVAVIIFIAGFGIGVSSGVYYMQKEAIKHDAGGYHAKTGEWD